VTAKSDHIVLAEALRRRGAEKTNNFSWLASCLSAEANVKVKGVSPTHALRLHYRASCVSRKPPFRFHLRFALSGRGTFVKRYKSTQKIWRPWPRRPAAGHSVAQPERNGLA